MPAPTLEQIQLVALTYFWSRSGPYPANRMYYIMCAARTYQTGVTSI